MRARSSRPGQPARQGAVLVAKEEDKTEAEAEAEREAGGSGGLAQGRMRGPKQ